MSTPTFAPMRIHAPSCRPRQSRGSGFTLVELLVVIGIIALLISILLPTLSRAREKANNIACSSNLRQLMQAFLMFANEHKGHLPGNYWDAKAQQKNPEYRDWLLGDNPNQGNQALQILDGPQNGTVYRYLNNMDVYRCPTTEGDTVGSGSNSNGRFDYAAFIVFSGAKVTNVKLRARFRQPDGTYDDVFTPIICEEEPQGGINGGNAEGGHCNTDRLGHNHPNRYKTIGGVPTPQGGSFYATIDGSVHYFLEPVNCNSWNWESVAPSGSWVSLGHVVAWNWWNKQ